MDEGVTYWLRLADGSQFGPGTFDVVIQWAQQGRVPAGAMLVPTAGGEPRPVQDVPELARILRAPPIVRGPMPQPADSAMSGLVPYRNPAALVGYYMGVFALIPVVGLLLGPAALICGIIGLRKGLKQPQSKGKAHAWVAISLGALTTIGYWGLVLLMYVAAANNW